VSAYLKAKKRIHRFEKEMMANATLESQLEDMEIRIFGLLAHSEFCVRSDHPRAQFTSEDAHHLAVYYALYTILKLLKGAGFHE
jgi:hypothetical protein